MKKTDRMAGPASVGQLIVLLFGALQVAPACAQAESTPQYIASSRGTVYYWVGCDNWRDIPEGNRRWFRTSSEAEAVGYRRSTARGCASPEITSGATPIDTGFCTIDRIVDGDTVVCLEAAERIRLLSIDAPETAEGAPAARAAAALGDLLPPGSKARMELDVRHRDQYGRILAYLYDSDGQMVNEAMARAGFALAVSYPPDVRYIDRIRAAADEARRERRGLWSKGAAECSPAGFPDVTCE